MCIVTAEEEVVTMSKSSAPTSSNNDANQKRESDKVAKLRVDRRGSISSADSPVLSKVQGIPKHAQERIEERQAKVMNKDPNDCALLTAGIFHPASSRVYQRSNGSGSDSRKSLEPAKVAFRFYDHQSTKESDVVYAVLEPTEQLQSDQETEDGVNVSVLLSGVGNTYQHSQSHEHLQMEGPQETEGEPEKTFPYSVNYRTTDVNSRRLGKNTFAIRPTKSAHRSHRPKQLLPSTRSEIIPSTDPPAVLRPSASMQLTTTDHRPVQSEPAGGGMSVSTPVFGRSRVSAPSGGSRTWNVKTATNNQDQSYPLQSKDLCVPNPSMYSVLILLVVKPPTSTPKSQCSHFPSLSLFVISNLCPSPRAVFSNLCTVSFDKPEQPAAHLMSVISFKTGAQLTYTDPALYGDQRPQPVAGFTSSFVDRILSQKRHSIPNNGAGPPPPGNSTTTSGAGGIGSGPKQTGSIMIAADTPPPPRGSGGRRGAMPRRHRSLASLANRPNPGEQKRQKQTRSGGNSWSPVGGGDPLIEFSQGHRTPSTGKKGSSSLLRNISIGLKTAPNTPHTTTPATTRFHDSDIRLFNLYTRYHGYYQEKANCGSQVKSQVIHSHFWSPSSFKTSQYISATLSRVKHTNRNTMNIFYSL
eukprot:sb/3462937/